MLAIHGTLTQLRPKILLSPLCYFEGPRNKYLLAAHRLFKTYAAGWKNNKKNNSRSASFFLSSDLAAGWKNKKKNNSGASQAQVTRPVTSISWSCGVTVSTLDSDSSDRGSNPRGTSCPPRLLSFPTACFFFHVLPAAIFSYAILPPGSKQHAYRQRSAGES